MKTVLVVQDDASIAMALGLPLKAMGYLVHTASDADSAIAQIRRVAPDVVLLDLALPAGDGFVAAEEIGRLEGFEATPIIFITASQRADLPERARNLGPIALLRKPFTVTQLTDAIESSLNPDGRWRPQRYVSVAG